MKVFRLVIALTVWVMSFQNVTAQTNKSIWTIDFVKVKNSQLDSAVLALQKNWAAARKYAKKMKFVKSYQLLVVNQEVKEHSDFDILLITEYKDKGNMKQEKKTLNLSSINIYPTTFL